MSKTGASPEFERKMQEIAEKAAHMVIPRSNVQTPLTEYRYPAWTEDAEPSKVIPAEAVEGHSRRPLDSGEYVCECGWVPDWHGASLARQVDGHLTEVQK